MSRSGSGLDVDRAIAADLADPTSLRGCCDGVQAVISLVGAPVWPVPSLGDTTFEATDRDGNLALFAEAESVGVERAVYLSVFGDYPPSLAYVEAHRAVERWLDASSLTATHVRATGFFGAFAVFQQLSRLGLSVNVSGGAARTNPIPPPRCSPPRPPWSAPSSAAPATCSPSFATWSPTTASRPRWAPATWPTGSASGPDHPPIGPRG